MIIRMYRIAQFHLPIVAIALAHSGCGHRFHSKMYRRTSVEGRIMDELVIDKVRVDGHGRGGERILVLSANECEIWKGYSRLQ